VKLTGFWRFGATQEKGYIETPIAALFLMVFYSAQSKKGKRQGAQKDGVASVREV
jgi:hypothetical protein